MALSTQRASTSLSSTESAPRWKHDVFLSFRGADNRKGFVSHLYNELQYWQAIKTFKDDRELEVGATISPELLSAIEASHLAIVVLSPNYASSAWCLDELVKILDSMETRDNTILPIFFHVDPCDVQYQRGSFAPAFAKHEVRFSDDIEKLKRWRAALNKVASLSGWDSKNYECERELIKVIVTCVWSKVRPTITLSDFRDKLVGIDSRLVKLGFLLAPDINDVRFIGIWGMGGMGKTTLAKLAFERISHHFEVSKFLVYVSEKHGALVDLQKQLLYPILKENIAQVGNEQEGTSFIRKCLSNKKVLLIVDNVNHYNQLQILVGNNCWFGKGSRVIITTRDQRLLIEHDIETFKVEGLNASAALELFSHNAFRKDEPQEGFSELSKRFVDYAKGLPLALKILGHSLYKRGRDEWISALDNLNNSPDTEIFSSLKISYDGLSEMNKNIFLDIAFFHKGKDKNKVIEILDKTYGFSSLFGINVLIEKTLLTIERGSNVEMHDLIQQMAWEIVCRESRDEPGFRSRLCHRDDIFHVFLRNTGTEAIKGIRLCLPKLVEADSSWNCGNFSKMSKLTFLELNNLIIHSGPKSLPDSLRILIWNWYPSRFLPGSYRPNLLTKLKMINSKLVQLWNGKQDLPCLKSIILSNSKNLTKIPDLTGIPNLKVLELYGCTGLVEIHSSIAIHKKLKILNLLRCKSIKSFPKEIEMDSLVYFNLFGCSKLKIPEFSRGMKNLYYLEASATATVQIPTSIERLVGLRELYLRDCKSLTCLPSAIFCKLKSLEHLHVTGCPKLVKLMENEGETECCLEKLTCLSIGQTAIRELTCLSRMKKLLQLNFGGSPVIGKHDVGFGRLLRRKSLEPLPLVLPSLRALCCLGELDLSDQNLCEGDILDDIGCLSSLRYLDLSGNNFVTLPATIQCLSKLRYIELKRCQRLQQLPDLPSNRELQVWVDHCASLKMLSEPSKLNKLIDLVDFRFSSLNCFALADDEGWNNTIFSMLRRVATQGISPMFYEFSVVSPGSKIPKWFNNQSEGDSLTVVLPADQNSIWMGITFCVVFAKHENPPSIEFDNFKIKCLSEGIYVAGWCLGKSGHSMRDHIWVFYMPRMKFQDTTRCHIKFLFDVCAYSTYGGRSHTYSSFNFVKKSGARLVYEQDLKELLNGTMNIPNKRTREYCEAEEGGPSESGRSKEESLFKRWKTGRV